MDRSPADVLRLVVATTTLLLLTLVTALFGDTLVGFSADLLRGFDAMPDWLITGLAIAIRVLAIAALVAGLVAALLRSGIQMLAAVLLAVGVGLLLTAALADFPDVIEDAAAAELSDSLGPITSNDFPSVGGIAAMAAALTAGAPWLSRRWRRCGWIAVFGLVVACILSSPMSFDSAEAAAAGWWAGAAVLVALGAPSRRPTPEAISEGLARSGLPLASLDPASVDARGSTPYFGVGEDGARYFVKALGDDQRSADLLFRLYRSIQRRELGDERPFSSLRRAVEHEAFVALTARDQGIPTPRVRTFAYAEPNAFVLAYEAIEGRSLDGVPAEELTDEVLADVWRQLGRLRSLRIAHRDLRLANIFLTSEGEIWMIDFGFSEVAASDLLIANDVAELVASSSAVVGAERATAHAVRSVDAATLAAARERLHLWALSGASRTALKAQPGLLDDLRARLTTS